MASLDNEIQYIKGVGPNRARVLNKLGIKTVLDLLYYCPRDWVDRTQIKTINQVKPGEKETVMGKVVSSETRAVRPRLKITKVLFRDAKGYISGVWFNQPYIEKAFEAGDTVILHGKVEYYRGNYQINTPEYEIIEDSTEPEAGNAKQPAIHDPRSTIHDSQSLAHTGRIVPIYPLTEHITQKQFRNIVKTCIDTSLSSLAEYMPPQVTGKYSLVPLKDAIYNVHYPDDFGLLEKAKKRLKFDEFFFLQLAYAMKVKGEKEITGYVFNTAGKTLDAFISALPFKFTSAQEKVFARIKTDLASGKPMNRLLQGDVGSGKTVVAMAAAATAKDSGFQAAIMAPTEILASQHMRNAEKILSGAGIRTALLIGGAAKKERSALLEKLKAGEIDLLIGTHSLLEADIEFKNLGLIVIDEQHRFGVMQRATLAGKSGSPHTLIMTATPIPRTLALTVYGDTDVSVIDELPPGRKPIVTKLFRQDKKDEIYAFISKRLDEGAQVYAVYPLVDDSEKIDLKSAIAMEKEWAKVFSGHNVSLIHGKMKKDEKDSVMEKFKKGEVRILVSTTVIEVGIDVPEASVMVIEHAERFGLSQLHQLRGRVGRGSAQSFCILVGDPRTEEGYKRLGIMEETQDGFRISEEDLAIRGPGEFMGTRQHGLPEFRVANIVKDRDVLEVAKEAAFDIVSGKCDISHSNWEQLLRIIKQKYKESFNLINIG